MMMKKNTNIKLPIHNTRTRLDFLPVRKPQPNES